MFICPSCKYVVMCCAEICPRCGSKLSVYTPVKKKPKEVTK